MLLESLPMTAKTRSSGPDGPRDAMPGARRRREGSRVLLAAALLAAVAGAFLAGGLAADALSGLLGLVSRPVRLAVRILLVVAAIPAAFYLVERFFLKRSSRP